MTSAQQGDFIINYPSFGGDMIKSSGIYFVQFIQKINSVKNIKSISFYIDKNQIEQSFI
jgi:hypothetical protein